MVFELTKADVLLAQVQRAVSEHQPELTVTTAEGGILLEGAFVVSDPAGPFDAYQIQVGIGVDFPLSAPIVFETGGRIPRILDRHIFPKHGNCCVGVWEEWLLTAPDQTFETYLIGVLHDYFVSQTYFEVNGEWPFGERSHGPEGVLESFADLLDVDCDADLIADYLRLLSWKKIKGHAPCPCGSGKKLRHCHREKLEALSQRIRPVMAIRMLNRIASQNSISKSA